MSSIRRSNVGMDVMVEMSVGILALRRTSLINWPFRHPKYCGRLFIENKRPVSLISEGVGFAFWGSVSGVFCCGRLHIVP